MANTERGKFIKHIAIYSGSGTGHNLFYLGLIIAELVKQDYKITLSLPKNVEKSEAYESYIKTFEPYINRVTHTGVNRSANPIMQSWQESSHIKKLISAFEPDFVFAPTGTQATFTWPFFRLIGYRTPYRFLMLSTGKNHVSSGLKAKIENKIRDKLLSLNGSQTLCTIDNVGLDQLKNQNKRSAKCFSLVPDPMNDFDKPEKQVIRKEYGFSDNDFIVAICGALDSHPRKNIGLLIEAICAIPSNENVKLVMAGKLNDQIIHILARLSADLRMRFILFNKYMTDQELINLTTAADLICTPYSEHFAPSGIVLRAIKCRTPVLVPNYHWFKFMVEEFGIGWVIPQLTLSELSDAITKAKAGTKNFGIKSYLKFPLLEQYYSTKNFVAHLMDSIVETEKFSFDDLVKQLSEQK
jgi:glycosyltransferase involved in cell wall biosynthesis